MVSGTLNGIQKISLKKFKKNSKKGVDKSLFYVIIILERGTGSGTERERKQESNSSMHKYTFILHIYIARATEKYEQIMNNKKSS